MKIKIRDDILHSLNFGVFQNIFVVEKIEYNAMKELIVYIDFYKHVCDIEENYMYMMPLLENEWEIIDYED